MLKKMSTLGLVLLLAFSPVATIAAETIEEDSTDETDQTTLDETTDTEEATEDPGEGEETSKPDEATSEEENAVEEDDNNAEAENEAEEAEANATDNATEEETTANEGAEEEESATEEEENDDADEELNLRDVFGNASGEIKYDFNKGYYVLHLRSGITNFHTNQEIKDKWVAFTLPNGVYMSDEGEIPSGVVRIGIAGKSGLAVKIPDVKSSGSETVTLDIPLAGVEDDNDPHLNMYLLDVDVNAGSYEEIGQLRGQRKIDFSVMTDPVELDLHGSITGKTEFDEDKGYHFLNVTVKAENQTDDNVKDIYVAFDLPEDVRVITNEHSPSNVTGIRKDDGGRAVALKLPELPQGDEKEVTYRIPVVGVSKAVVESNTIPVYRITDSGYTDIGEFEGYVKVDFSDMDVEWKFTAKSEIITDYPGLSGNEFGFRFNYEVKNINLDDVEKVELEFVVPNDIKIQKPVYNDSLGNADISWKGNTARVTLGDLEGASGWKGYFTATGTSSKSLNQLKDLDVTVTLYRDGETIVKTIKAPFVFGTYDDDGFGDDDGNDDNGTGGGNNGTGGDNGNGGNKGGTGDNGKGSTNDGGGTGSDDNSGGDVKVTVDGGDDSSNDSKVTVGSSDSDKGGNLPKTATNTYTMLLIGFIVVVAGGSLMFFRKKGTIN